MKRGAVLFALILACGAGALLIYRTWYHAESVPDNRIPAVDLQRKVTLRFLECAGKHAVFVLENGTDHPIYARVHRHDFWPEFKDANLQFGLHLIEYRASSDAPLEDVGPMFDAIERFRPIMPNEIVRYGVDLHMGAGQYIVKVPYMKDAELVHRMEEAYTATLKTDSDRIESSWREVSSGVVTTTCR